MAWHCHSAVTHTIAALCIIAVLAACNVGVTLVARNGMVLQQPRREWRLQCGALARVGPGSASQR